jgi:hypothetical protein
VVIRHIMLNHIYLSSCIRMEGFTIGFASTVRWIKTRRRQLETATVNNERVPLPAESEISMKGKGENVSIGEIVCLCAVEQADDCY